MQIDDINIALAAALLSNKAISAGELDNALTAAQESGHRLDRYFTLSGILPEAALMDAISQAADVSQISGPDRFELSSEDFDEATAEYFVDSSLCPVCFESETLIIATADPFDEPLLQMLRFHLGRDVKAVLASRTLISDILLKQFSPINEGNALEDTSQLAELAQQGPVVSVVQDTLAKAAERGASDIHIETLEHGLLVRLRVEGFLSDLPVDRTVTATAMITRLKVLAELNISERRLPQDGRFRVRLHGRNIDLRMSTLPTQFGESVVLRLLDQNRAPKGLDDLGMTQDIPRSSNPLGARF